MYQKRNSNICNLISFEMDCWLTSLKRENNKNAIAHCNFNLININELPVLNIVVRALLSYIRLIMPWNRENIFYSIKKNQIIFFNLKSKFWWILGTAKNSFKFFAFIELLLPEQCTTKIMNFNHLIVNFHYMIPLNFLPHFHSMVITLLNEGSCLMIDNSTHIVFGAIA